MILFKNLTVALPCLLICSFLVIQGTQAADPVQTVEKARATNRPWISVVANSSAQKPDPVNSCSVNFLFSLPQWYRLNLPEKEELIRNVLTPLFLTNEYPVRILNTFREVFNNTLANRSFKGTLDIANGTPMEVEWTGPIQPSLLPYASYLLLEIFSLSETNEDSQFRAEFIEKLSDVLWSEIETKVGRLTGDQSQNSSPQEKLRIIQELQTRFQLSQDEVMIWIGKVRQLYLSPDRTSEIRSHLWRMHFEMSLHHLEDPKTQPLSEKESNSKDFLVRSLLHRLRTFWIHSAGYTLLPRSFTPRPTVAENQSKSEDSDEEDPEEILINGFTYEISKASTFPLRRYAVLRLKKDPSLDATKRLVEMLADRSRTVRKAANRALSDDTHDSRIARLDFSLITDTIHSLVKRLPRKKRRTLSEIKNPLFLALHFEDSVLLEKLFLFPKEIGPYVNDVISGETLLVHFEKQELTELQDKLLQHPHITLESVRELQRYRERTGNQE